MIKDTLMKGLKFTLPLLITLLLIVWTFQAVESLFRNFIEPWFPYYFEGLGAIVGIILVFLMGLFVNVWIVRRTTRWLEKQIDRIPFVKTIYSSIQESIKLFDDKKSNFGTPVIYEFNKIKIIGFITSEKMPHLPVKEDEVAVYFPLSYQIGGYTAILPRSQVTPLEWSIQDTMKFVLMAGVIGEEKKPS